MTPSRTHPHTEMPTEDVLERVIAGTQPGHRDLYLETHRLLRETVPGIAYSVDRVDGAIGYGAHQLGYNGWGMGAVVPHTGWLSLVLFRGGALEDPDALLEGTGAMVRHVKIRSLDDLRARGDAIRALVRAAASAS